MHACKGMWCETWDIHVYVMADEVSETRRNQNAKGVVCNGGFYTALTADGGEPLKEF